MMLRTPRKFTTQASFAPVGEAVSSVVKAKPSTWSRVKGGC